MRVRWTPDACADLERVGAWIEQESPAAALRITREVYRAVAGLSRWPNRGRIGWVPDTRELVLTPLPYVVVYRVRESVVEILHIYHGSRNWRQ